MQTVVTVVQPASHAALRMRRFRERRRQGKVCFLVELDPREISGLVELKWLPGSHRDDRAAVVNAFCRLVEYVLVTQHEHR